MYKETKELYEFGPFRLDVEEHTLTRSDGSKNHMLPEKAFQTLCVLVQRRGHLLPKQELLTEIWPDSFVEENNLDKCIHAIRQVLGEKPGEQKYIETVRKHGYRFVADVRRIESETDSQGSKNLVEFPKSQTYTPSILLTVVKPRESAEPTLQLNRSDDLVSARPGIAAVPPLQFTQSAKSKRNLITAICAIALLVTGVAAYFIFPWKGTTVGQKKSIAVLPLKPINTAVRDEIYEVGIADSLIHKLSSIKGFIVRPLSATRKYADIEQDAIAAGKEQQVDYVLASNYQLADGKIKITAQLLNVANGQIEDTYKSEKDAASVFEIQDAFAGEVGDKLSARFGTTLSGSAATRGTTNEEAYRLFIQGTVLVGKRTQESSRKAVEYLEQAVGLDPNYALAYARLAHAYNTQVSTGGTKNGVEDYLKAKAAIEKALALDPNLAEAHSYLGEMMVNYDADLAGAEREHKLAVALNPNSSTARRMYALLLSRFGRFDEAFAEIKTAIDLEPATQVNHHAYGFILWLARRCDEAITVQQRVLEMDPKSYFSYNVIHNCYRFKGDADKAFEAFLQMSILSGDEPGEIDKLRAIYAKRGLRGVSERELEYWKAAEKRGNRNYNHLAFHSIELGQNEEAFAYLEKAFVEDRSSLQTLKVNPRYDPLRSDPRFDDLVRRVGLK